MHVDWELAAGSPAAPRVDDAARAERRAAERLAEIAAAARDQVVAATGLEPRGALPPAEWVDRGAWIDANLATMRSTIGPALEGATGGATPPAPGAARGSIQQAGGAVVAAEIGGLLGLFARRVLGQYELDLTDPDAPPRLLLVGPNLDRAARRAGRRARQGRHLGDAARGHARGAVRRGRLAAPDARRRAAGAAGRDGRQARPAHAAQDQHG